MILADKILALRRNSGWSQEEMADKLNVSRQSVSKWESAQSIPDINKILEMAKLFGVTTDYLLKDDMESVAYSGDDEGKYPRVSVQEANAFMSDNAFFGKRLAMSVMLFILSPVLLILLAGIAELNIPGNTMTVGLASGIGVVVLLLMIASGVFLIIFSSHKVQKYEYLKKGEFELEYGVEGIVREKRSAYERRNSVSVAAGVAMCILSAVPLIIAGASDAPEFVCILLTGLMFAIIACAVFLFITAGVRKSSCDQLLRLGDYTASEIEVNKRADKLGAIYWPCATAVYLAISFLTFRWDITWVIWPVAALLFVGISHAVKDNREN